MELSWGGAGRGGVNSTAKNLVALKRRRIRTREPRKAPGNLNRIAEPMSSSGAWRRKSPSNFQGFFRWLGSEGRGREREEPRRRRRGGGGGAISK
jgi:hypothetical protein